MRSKPYIYIYIYDEHFVKDSVNQPSDTLLHITSLPSLGKDKTGTYRNISSHETCIGKSLSIQSAGC